jgi:hypothetical protein
VPVILLGNVSVLEAYKPDPETNVTLVRKKQYAGNRVTTFHLHETEPVRNSDGSLGPEERPSRSLNLSMLLRIWPEHSDKPPAWITGDDDLLVALVADSFGGVPTKRPKDWKEG